MAQSLTLQSSTYVSRGLIGFIAGFAATLIFHQVGVLLLHQVGVIQNFPYDLHPVPPLHVPRFISLAFWGGVWGIAFVFVERGFGYGPLRYWIGAIVFGAIFPTAASWVFVAPLKGLPLGYGLHFPGVFVGPIVNGLWGFGTAVFVYLMGGRSRPWV